MNGHFGHMYHQAGDGGDDPGFAADEKARKERVNAERRKGGKSSWWKRKGKGAKGGDATVNGLDGEAIGASSADGVVR